MWYERKGRITDNSQIPAFGNSMYGVDPSLRWENRGWDQVCEKAIMSSILAILSLPTQS